MKANLEGHYVLNTRPLGQADALTALCRDYGAEVLEFPCIELSSCLDEIQLRKSLEWLGVESWVFFTSANGVRFVCEQIDLSGQKIAVIGEQTASALGEFGIDPAFVSSVSNSEDFADEFISKLVSSRAPKKALLLRASLASAALPERLLAAGFEVHLESVYESQMPEISRERLLTLHEALPRLSVLFFTSSQAIRNFSELLSEKSKCWELAKKIPLVVIGPKTAATAEALEFSRVISAEQASIESLLEAAVAQASE